MTEKPLSAGGFFQEQQNFLIRNAQASSLGLPGAQSLSLILEGEEGQTQPASDGALRGPHFPFAERETATCLCRAGCCTRPLRQSSGSPGGQGACAGLEEARVGGRGRTRCGGGHWALLQGRERGMVRWGRGGPAVCLPWLYL